MTKKCTDKKISGKTHLRAAFGLQRKQSKMTRLMEELPSVCQIKQSKMTIEDLHLCLQAWM